MSNSVDPDQTAPIGAVFSGSTLFAYMLNSSVMLGNYLQQTTSADDIFRCIFSWRFRVNIRVAVGWSTVYDCGISWSHSLFPSAYIPNVYVITFA